MHDVSNNLHHARRVRELFVERHLCEAQREHIDALACRGTGHSKHPACHNP
jgi:hypothetical protein